MSGEAIPTNFLNYLFSQLQFPDATFVATLRFTPVTPMGQ